MISWDKAKSRPVIGQRGVVLMKMGAYDQDLKSNMKPAVIKNPGLVSQAKPGRTEIRREEPRRSAPRATGRTAERGNQPRSHKSGQK